MSSLPSLPLTPSSQISKEFAAKNIFSFTEALHFVKHLPYGRNADKNNLATVFTDGCGTCSTKHALLKQLATENNFTELQLMTGIFKMNAINTPAVSATLQKHKLEYIPEAHCYLKFKGEVIDCTKANSKPSDFLTDLMEEKEITPEQITDYKVAYHKTFLQNWLAQHPEITLSLNELWAIREQCIQDLSA